MKRGSALLRIVSFAVVLLVGTSACNEADPRNEDVGAPVDTLAGFRLGDTGEAVEAAARQMGVSLTCAPALPAPTDPPEGPAGESCSPEGVERHAEGYFEVVLDDDGTVRQIYRPHHREISVDSLRREMVAGFGEPVHEDDMDHAGYLARWERGGAARLLTCLDEHDARQCAEGVLPRRR